MSKFKIVFNDGFTVIQEASSFSKACVLASHARLLAGGEGFKELFVAESQCSIMGG